MTEAAREGHRSCVCPWWLMRFFDHRVRSLVQPTGPVLGSLVAPGNVCLDMGCGMGYFSVPLARQAGPGGHVTGVDIESQMLAGAARRAKQEGLQDRISLFLTTDSAWVLPKHYDFILAFWMLHEVPDRRSLLETFKTVLRPSGRFLLVEPRMHVSAESWTESLALAERVGFRRDEMQSVRFSRAALMQ
jgi:ubiquinone/menaquinone biosynthesis C-methylase UbiE